MRLETERLLIRPYEMDDLDDFCAIFSDPEVMAQCAPPYDRAACEKWLSCFIQNPIAFAVVEKQSGRMIGHALFKQLPGEEDGIWEIGWIYNRAFWRKGYAYEAARAQIDHGFAHLNLHKVCAETIDPVKSVRLMEKLGMQQEGVFRRHVKNPVTGRWADLYWYAVLNPAMQAT